MRKIIVTLFLLYWAQTPAFAGPHEDGIAAGNAANAFSRGTVDGASADTEVR